MKIIKSHKILIFYIFILVVGITLNLLSFFLFVSFKPNALQINAREFSSNGQTLQYRLLNENDNKRMTFSTDISKNDLNLPGEGNYAVLVYQLNCQAYKISFNDDFIGSIGDLETGNSNIWNGIHCFFFDADNITEKNSLSIHTLSLYDRGFSSMPVYIMKTSELNSYIGLATYFTDGINLMGIGFAVFACIIIFMLYLVSSPKNSSFLFFSFALLFLGLYTLDFTSLYSIPMDYLLYKKLIFMSLYLSVSFASMGMYKFFHRKADFVLCILTTACYLFIFVFVQDMIVFKSIYNYYNLIVIINLLSWLRTSRIHLKKTDEAKMFFIGNIMLLFYALIDIIITITGSIFSLSTPFAYSFVFSMISIIVFFREFLNKDHQLQIVNNAHKESYQASITDGMTGLYNHRYLIDVLMQTKPPYSVAMLDIDDFKEINDSFGHRFGDDIIRYLAKNLSGHVRSTDIVFRYGGDEFFIIFPNCTAENAKDVIQKIQLKINENSLKYDNQTIPITFSGGIYYVPTPQDMESVFDRVDNPLYRSKKEGKNKVTIFNIED